MAPVLNLFVLLIMISFSGCRDQSGYPNCSSKDIELMDTCLLGNTIEQAIDKMGIDTTDFIPILLFARQVSGIYLRLSDTCKITIMVEKPFIMTNEQLETIETNGRLNNNWKGIYRYILDQKIIGICWRKNFARKVRVVGTMYHNCLDT